MLHSEAYELLAEYAAGSLSKAQRKGVEAHLDSGCVVCQSELNSLRNALHALIEFDGLEAPPERVKAELLKRIEDPAREPPRPRVDSKSVARPRGWMRYAIAATVLIAVGTPLFSWLAGPEDLAPGMAGGPRAPAQGPRVRMVDFSIGGQPQGIIRHAIYDEASEEMHVWVGLGDDPAQPSPQLVRVVGPAGRVLADAPLDAKEGVAGAVIHVPGMPERGRLMILANPDVAGDDAALEELPFELR